MKKKQTKSTLQLNLPIKNVFVCFKKLEWELNILNKSITI